MQSGFNPVPQCAVSGRYLVGNSFELIAIIDKGSEINLFVFADTTKVFIVLLS